MLLEAQDSRPEVRADPTFNEFINGPLVYSGAYQHNISGLSPETFDLRALKGDTIRFSFMSDLEIENIELSVHRGDQVKAFRSAAVKDSAGRYTVDHSFIDKGRHIVHVMLDNSYAFTYTIKVN